MNCKGTPPGAWILVQEFKDKADPSYTSTYIVGVFSSFNDVQRFMVRNVGHRMYRWDKECCAFELRYVSSDPRVDARFCAWSVDAPHIDRDWTGNFEPIYEEL